MLPLEGETLTPDDIDLFERAQAAQANKPFVPSLAPPETGSGRPPSAMPTDLAVPLVPPQATPATAPLAAPAAMPMRQPATPAGFQLGAGILQQPTQPARSDDPFGNLSKQQRMMLAFSAISDPMSAPPYARPPSAARSTPGASQSAVAVAGASLPTPAWPVCDRAKPRRASVGERARGSRDRRVFARFRARPRARAPRAAASRARCGRSTTSRDARDTE